MKKRRNILILSSALFLLASLFMLGWTYGWISLLTSFPNNEVSVGSLRYTKSGSFDTSKVLIVPGEELIDAAFSLTNTSPISSSLRLQITYTFVEDPEAVTHPTVILDDAEDAHLFVEFDDTYVYQDDYFYYQAIDYEIPANSGLIPILSSISYNGDYAGIAYSQVDIQITIIIQVKQFDHVEWSTLLEADYDLEAN